MKSVLAQLILESTVLKILPNQPTENLVIVGKKKEVEQEKPKPAPSFKHREFRSDAFWRNIPAWAELEVDRFLNHTWQSQNSIRNIDQLKPLLQDKISNELIADIEAGIKLAPMNVRITPYVFSLIDWDKPLEDPLRKQFLPVASQHLPDHPMHMIDSLHEDVDSPVPLLTHRYPDKVLFLPLTTCPVYCSYCTRSRLIGGSTEILDKTTYGADPSKWAPVFEYLKDNPQIEDVVVSGGDAYNLAPRHITEITDSLLALPNIRRIRIATKGLAIFPMKVLSDTAWTDAVVAAVDKGRKLGKHVVIHTHFSSPKEITAFTKIAADFLFSKGVIVRNQAVMQTGINDDPETMILLTKQLSYINIQPYYVYLHDMIQGCEHLRTSLDAAVKLEKSVRGITAGFNTPTFVCDAPGGGGKRHIASYEYYDRETGISVWAAPSVKAGKHFLYFDPLRLLSKEAQTRWADEKERAHMIEAAKKAAGVQ